MNSMVVSDRAQRRVNEFRQRCGEYGEAALHLAYHAALPVALNAELLHLLRINFFLDPPEVLPYTVEFEFLLSPLCREIDEGLYEIELEIRDILLAGLTQTYGTERIHDIATLLWQYVERQNCWSERVELERAQQLTVLNFLAPKKAQQWLVAAETEVSQGQVAAREWFIAMRQELKEQDTILRSGKFNVTIGTTQNFHVGDCITEATPEQIRLIVHELVQELKSENEQTVQKLNEFNRLVETPQDIHIGDRITGATPDQIRLIARELIREVQKLHSKNEQTVQKLNEFNQLVETVQDIQLSDRITGATPEQIRLIVRELTQELKMLQTTHSVPSSTVEEEDGSIANYLPFDVSIQEAQQSETMILQTFVHRLENSRIGADWVQSNMEMLLNYACKVLFNKFPDLDASTQNFDDFKFSLQQFLEQVSFCLNWGSYDILDNPEIPLVLEIEHYETAFQSMKGCISTRLSSETIHEIEACLDYLIKRMCLY